MSDTKFIATLTVGSSYTVGGKTFIKNKPTPVDETLFIYLKGIKMFDTEIISGPIEPLRAEEIFQIGGPITVQDLGTATLQNHTRAKRR